MNKTIAIFVMGLACSIIFTCCKGNENPTVVETRDTIKFADFAMGVDLSYVNQVEDHGGVYKENNVPKDPFVIFKEKGANCVRVRLWHNPQWIRTQVYDASSPLYSGFPDVLKTIERAKAQGMAVNLDFHYSDIWADPTHQDVPGAWKNITDIKVLSDSVYAYTYQTLLYLMQKSLLPEMVQIGNETNCGMMISSTLAGFPDLNACNGNWANLGKIINAGILAVRNIDALSGKHTIVALHIADPKNLDWWFSGITGTGGVSDFDVIGFSYYHTWHTTIAFNNIPATVKAIKTKFKKDVMVLETAYAFTSDANDSYNNRYYNQAIVPGFPYTPTGQREFMKAFTQNMMTAGAKGVMYWEPAWITSNMHDLWGTGSSWENCAFFDFTGNVTIGIDYLNANYSK